ncbi:preprotein translocase subunit YajC [Agrococcus sp. SGAir0287]|uniref:preprotein translocase subunit YajC n=1 Tax=Agrococcus sp. SGAir0287 TaxID=2070347 RepID=UPI0010CD3793|nr:preprotein translocase subunit YajC [Agrococcus sp. SGAir0287]QCR19334.1 preprotein translocase subunit YajC [Agrococcus sp. SGAir0287]
MHTLIQSANDNAQTGGIPFDPLTIGMLLILAVLIFFMFRNSKKRKAQQQELQTKMVPGADVMTNFGLFGTLVAVDEDTNEALIEVAPGTTLRVHRQTLARVVENESTPEESSVDDAETGGDGTTTERP